MSVAFVGVATSRAELSRRMSTGPISTRIRILEYIGILQAVGHVDADHLFALPPQADHLAIADHRVEKGVGRLDCSRPVLGHEQVAVRVPVMIAEAEVVLVLEQVEGEYAIRAR